MQAVWFPISYCRARVEISKLTVELPDLEDDKEEGEEKAKTNGVDKKSDEKAAPIEVTPTSG